MPLLYVSLAEKPTKGGLHRGAVTDALRQRSDNCASTTEPVRNLAFAIRKCTKNMASRNVMGQSTEMSPLVSMFIQTFLNPLKFLIF